MTDQEKKKKMRAFQASLRAKIRRADPKSMFSCVGGPYDKMKLSLSRPNIKTATFTVNGETGFYRGRLDCNTVRWYDSFSSNW